MVYLLANLEGITIKQPTANDIAIAKKGKPDFKRVPEGTKIRQEPRDVQPTQRTISQPKPDITKTPAVLLKGRKLQGNRVAGPLLGVGAALSAVGGGRR